MKNLTFISAALLCTLFVFTSCKKDEVDRHDIVAQVENGKDFESEIDSVATALGFTYPDIYTKGKVDYINGGFSMDLEPVKEEHLNEKISDIYGNPGLNISGGDVKIFYNGSLYFFGIKNNSPTGFFILTKATIMDVIYDLELARGIIDFLYAENDASITGTTTRTSTSPDKTTVTKYNLQIKKGWNYISTKHNIKKDNFEEISITCPADLTGYKWQYFPFEKPEIFPVKKHFLIE